MSRHRSQKSPANSRSTSDRSRREGSGFRHPRKASPRGSGKGLGPCPWCEAERTGKPLPPARREADGLLLEAVTQHVEEHIGRVDGSVQATSPGAVEVTLLWVPPARGRPWHTFVSSGMAQRPMRVPEGCRSSPYAELMLCLPARWPAATIASNPRRSWPIDELRALAALPHETGRHLAWGHTISEPRPRAYARGTKLCACLVRSPVLVPDEFRFMQVGDGREVEFLALVPITRNELALKRHGELGALELDRLLRRAGVTELCEPRRADVTQVVDGQGPSA